MWAIDLDVVATDENFNEELYLISNPDVRRAVEAGTLPSGRAHFEHFGRREGRRIPAAVLPEFVAMRAEKMRRLEPLLDLSMAHVRRGDKYDFLTDELRQAARIVETQLVSSNPYAPRVTDLINRHEHGLVLDCGAGRRRHYLPNVVNYEIVDYDSTDVLGIGERLPFRDGSFDAVISMAVLEHVRDPFACAAELVRVLKPGGELACGVPFLQPLHGYPHHYYNMTGQGLRALFEEALVIDEHIVDSSSHPIWSLTWIIRSWERGLDPALRPLFRDLRVSDLLTPPNRLLRQPWVTGLSEEAQWELAAGTFLLAHKPRE